MDDVFGMLPSWMFTAIVAVVVLVIIGIIFARLYRRASAEQAFVRTGLGGQKVVMSGGAIVMPIFHEIIPINMNTLKLEVSRSTVDSLITKDRMRVDVVVAFFVRVKPSVEGIATAAQTLGQRTLSPEDLRVLIEDKFVDALRATASQMTMHELQDTRENFVQGVQNTVAEDLSKNGLELESVSLTNFNQTEKVHFNPNNAFDAEGLTKLTQETERRRRERNEVEQDVEVAVREKNRDALARKLEIEQQEAFMTLEQEQQVKTRTAEQNAKIAAFEAERHREAEQTRILAERQIQETEIEREQAVRSRKVEAEREVRIKEIEQQQATEPPFLSQEHHPGRRTAPFFSSKFPSFIKRFSLLLCYSFFKNSQIPSRLFTKESPSLFIYSTKMSSPDCPFVRISLKFCSSGLRLIPLPLSLAKRLDIYPKSDIIRMYEIIQGGHDAQRNYQTIQLPVQRDQFPLPPGGQEDGHLGQCAEYSLCPVRSGQPGPAERDLQHLRHQQADHQFRPEQAGAAGPCPGGAGQREEHHGVPDRGGAEVRRRKGRPPLSN